MKKTDLKKLALLGITGGVMLASQGLNAAQINNSSLLNNNMQHNGCGGGKCGSPSNRGNGCGATNHCSGGNHCSGQSHCSGSDHCNGQYDKKSGNNPNRSYNRTVAMNDEPDEYEEGEAEDYKDGTYVPGSSGSGSYKSGKPAAYPRPEDERRAPYGRPTSYNDNQMNKNANTTYDKMDDQPINEDQFVKQLDSEGRRLYNSLSPEGKKLAQRLSKQYSDKNQAVKHAARQVTHPDASNS